MSDSILFTVKSALGLDPENTPFDIDVIMHINSVFANLQQLGIGPSNGFMIMDGKPTWEEFLGQDNTLNSVKSFVFLKVRLLFDPPATGPAIAAMQDLAKEFEWRINVARETKQWTSPMPPPTGVSDNPLKDPVIDGGVG